MRNHWTDKCAVNNYLELLIKEISSLCGADPDSVRVTIEQEVANRPFTSEEIEQLLKMTEDQISAEAKRIHAFLTNDSSDGLW
jgi:phenylalanyl-tRNA synthetase beta subunit